MLLFVRIFLYQKKGDTSDRGASLCFAFYFYVSDTITEPFSS